MFERVKSYSKGGANIQRVLSIERYKIDDTKLNNILNARNPLFAQYNQHSKAPVQKQGFDKVPGRQKPNSFLLFNVKDNNNALNYEVNEVIRPRTTALPIRRENSERLSHLLAKDKYKSRIQTKTACKRLQQTNNEHIRTARDLQQGRKTFHSIDFQKQTQRPFDQKLKKSAVTEQRLYLTRTNSQAGFSKNSQTKEEKQQIAKLKKTHSFASYTKREFLNENKIHCAPEVSGIDSYKINPEKFKGNWKTVSAQKFQHTTNKYLNRYDRDCPPWYTQLAYNIKENPVNKTPLSFNKQTDRKQNLVKSGYPIRMAV